MWRLPSWIICVKTNQIRSYLYAPGNHDRPRMNCPITISEHSGTCRPGQPYHDCDDSELGCHSRLPRSPSRQKWCYEAPHSANVSKFAFPDNMWNVD
jgi:hypothetical protein